MSRRDSIIGPTTLDPDVTRRTPLAGRNQIDCEECGDVIEGDLKWTVRWGFWNVEAQSFEKNAREEHYCQSCWQQEYKREAAAHYEVTDAEKLWNILEAADGDLVADLRPIFVGGRPFIRVVDGELQALGSTVHAEEYDGGETRLVKFGSKRVEVDREWFDETFRADQELPDDAHPTIALLKPAEETPFAGYRDVHPDQTTLGDGEVADADD